MRSDKLLSPNSYFTPESPDREDPGVEGRALGAAEGGLCPVVLITGGSDGIGRAIADRFAQNGCDLFLIARDGAGLSAAAQEIEGRFGVRVRTASVDLFEPNSVDQILAHVAEAGCYVETLVNSVASGLGGPFCSAERSDLTRVVDLNVAVTTELMRACLPGMVRHGAGGVLNVASLAGMIAVPYLALYSASKSYLITLCRALAGELKGTGVRMSVIVPGPVDTKFLGQGGLKTLRFLPTLSARSVARVAFDGYMARQTVISVGVLGLLCRFGLKVLPHAFLLKIIGAPLRKAYVPTPEGAGGVAEAEDERPGVERGASA